MMKFAFCCLFVFLPYIPIEAVLIGLSPGYISLVVLATVPTSLVSNSHPDVASVTAFPVTQRRFCFRSVQVYNLQESWVRDRWHGANSLVVHGNTERIWRLKNFLHLGLLDTRSSFDMLLNSIKNLMEVSNSCCKNRETCTTGECYLSYLDEKNCKILAFLSLCAKTFLISSENYDNGKKMLRKLEFDFAP